MDPIHRKRVLKILELLRHQPDKDSYVSIVNQISLEDFMRGKSELSSLQPTSYPEWNDFLQKISDVEEAEKLYQQYRKLERLTKKAKWIVIYLVGAISVASDIDSVLEGYISEVLINAITAGLYIGPVVFLLGIPGLLVLEKKKADISIKYRKIMSKL
jgi:hypothetical protein